MRGLASPETSRSASASSRSTVSPAVRQPAPACGPRASPPHARGGSGRALGERRRPRPGPGFGEIEHQRVGAEIEIGGERAQQRLVLRAAAAPRPRDRDAAARRDARRRGLSPSTCSPSRICNSFSSHRNPSSFFSADAGLLAGRDAAIAVDPGSAGALQDLGGERRDAPDIAARRLVILVDQPLDLGLRAIAAGAGQGRGQVIDDDGLRPPLRLAALAGIVDDERVEMRQRTQRRLRESIPPTAPAPCPAAIRACRACRDRSPRRRGNCRRARHRRRDRNAAAPGPGRDRSLSGRDCSRAPAGSAPRCCRRGSRGSRTGRNRAAPDGRTGRARRCPSAPTPAAAPVAAGWRKTPNTRRRTASPRPARGAVHCSGRQAAAASARRRPRACRRCGSRPRAAPAGSRPPMPACRARRRCRCGRRGSGSWRARSRPAARPAAWRAAAPSCAPDRRQRRPGRRPGDSRPDRPRFPGSRPSGALNDTARDRMRPSISGSATFIARSRGPRPRVLGAPRFFVAAGEHDLQDRAIGAQRIAAARRRQRKPGRVQDHRGRMRREHVGEQRGGLGILEAADENRQRPQPRAPPAPAPAHRPAPCCRTARAPGRTRSGRPRPRPATRRDLGEARRSRAPASTARRAAAAPARPIRFSRGRDQARRIAQKIVGIARPAFRQIAPQPAARSGRHGRETGQFGVGLVVAGQQRERDARCRGRSRPAARRRRANRRCRRAAGRSTSRARATVSIYRSTEKLWPSRITGASRKRRRRRVLGAPPRLRRREQRDLGVGARQHDDVARRLGEIDRGRSVGDDARVRWRADAFSRPRRRSRPASAASTAARSRPFLPITTSRVARASPAAQGRSKCCSMRPPTAWIDEAAVAARHIGEALDPQHVLRADRGGEPGAERRRYRPPGRSRRQSCRNRRGRARLRSRAATAAPRDRPRRAPRARAPPPAAPCPARPRPALPPAAAAPRSRRRNPARAAASRRSVLFRITRSAQSKLVGEHLLERVVVVDRRIGAALPRDRLRIVGEAARPRPPPRRSP